jgi:hypothetical protein
MDVHYYIKKKKGLITVFVPRAHLLIKLIPILKSLMFDPSINFLYFKMVIYHIINYVTYNLIILNDQNL